jgi:Beta-galactosidase
LSLPWEDFFVNNVFETRRIALAAVLASGALLAACGGGDQASSQSETAAAAPKDSGAYYESDGWDASDIASDFATDFGEEPVASIDAETIVSEQAMAAAGGATKKWNPGHYVVLGTNSGPAMADRLLSDIARFPWVKGLVIRTSWADLEPNKGNYNFSSIDAALNKVASRGKRAFILVGTKSFGDGDGGAVPRYMRTGEYGGGAYKIRIKRGGYGENMALHNNNVANRLMALNQALANRYNRNNNVEGMIYNETALGQAVNPLSAAQRKVFFDNMARVDIAASKAFSNTTVIQFMNSPRPEVPNLWNKLVAAKMGVGGPDVYLRDKGLNTLLPGYNRASGNVPIGVQVEPASYRSYMHAGPFAPPPVTSLFAFARDKMKANYVFWVPDTSKPHNPWPKVQSMWASGSFPKSSTGGLNGNCPRGMRCVGKL